MQTTFDNGVATAARGVRAGDALAYSTARRADTLAVAPDRGFLAGDLIYASDALSLQRALRTLLQRAFAMRAAGQTPRLGTLRLDVSQPDGTPVRLVVAQNAGALEIVAVCAPAQRARIERCLARLSEKFAASGIALDYKVHQR